MYTITQSTQGTYMNGTTAAVKAANRGVTLDGGRCDNGVDVCG